MKKFKIQNSKFALITLNLFTVFLLVTAPVVSFAAVSDPPAPAPTATQTLKTPTDPELNPNKSTFKIVVCDGPAGAKPAGDSDYVPCDFNGVMRQVSHLINIAMVLGVLVAIAMFSWAGFLYITGKKANIDKAHSIFPKVFFGFIIMLSAWFIIYQLLGWLTNNPGFKALLGTP